MDIPTLLIIFGIALQMFAIIILVFTKKTKQQSQQEDIKTYTTTNPQEIEQLMKAHNITYDAINHLRDPQGNFTSIQATRTLKYENGRIINDTVTIEKIPNTNFCPNCGKKIDNPNNYICPYCNTNFTITK